MEKPSNTGEQWHTPSPQSRTTPEVLPCAYKLRTDYVWKKILGDWNLSKKSSAAYFLFEKGFKGASVSKIGCSLGDTLRLSNT